MTSTVNYLLQKLSNLEKISKIAQSSTKIQQVTPVFKWAQSLDKIFIKVKFAHRWDSPGCLDLWGSKFTILEDKKGIDFECFGIQGDHPLKFKLKFPLLKEISKGEFQSESVGTGVITLEKKEKNNVWRTLIEREYVNKKKIAQKVWWEMNKQFPDAERYYNMMLKKEEEFLDKVRLIN